MRPPVTVPPPVRPPVRPVPPPVPVPRPYAPAYVNPYAVGAAIGVLTVLPAAAILLSTSNNQKVYVVDQRCYIERRDASGTVYYEEIACP